MKNFLFKRAWWSWGLLTASAVTKRYLREISSRREEKKQMKILELSRKMFFKCEHLNYFYFLFLMHTCERESEREKHEVDCSVRPQVSSWIFLNLIFLLHIHTVNPHWILQFFVSWYSFSRSVCLYLSLCDTQSSSSDDESHAILRL